MTNSVPRLINNFIHGKHVIPSTSKYLPVHSPIDSSIIASVAISSKADVDDAVQSAQTAFHSWSALTTKSRAAILLKFHTLVKDNSHELAQLIVEENGKNFTEALADVAKGNETVEYACSMPQLCQGKTLRVSSAVKCEDRRDALGVVASIVPFNFPFMVPMWTMPIALVMGNTIVLKPSEKVPLTMYRTAELLKEAGVPDGVVNLVQGGREAVEGLIDHPDVRAVTFVGSSPIAKLVSDRCHSLYKRCTALGGAKNHLVALEDCDIPDTARDVVVSAFGCAGQRCMAASVLLTMKKGDGSSQQELLEAIMAKAKSIERGTGPGQLGPVIDEHSFNKITKYIEEAEKSGAKILMDGRSWKDSDSEPGSSGGNWIGPTIIQHSSASDAAMTEEIFGPVLSILEVNDWSEAITIENSNDFGNAACIYTSNGGYADWFVHQFRASMLGINVGIPVPREPFSFGGLYGTKSKYGDMDITGDGAMEFFSNRIKVTSKWVVPKGLTTPSTSSSSSAMNGGSSNGHHHHHSNGVAAATDHANFAGTM